MKRILSLLALFAISSNLFSQANLVVPKSELHLHVPSKAIAGTEWVKPVKASPKQLKTMPDTITLAPVTASRFYFEKEVYDSLIPDSVNKEYHFTKDFVNRMNREVLKDRLRPFMMKKWEVTNAEYREFLADIDITMVQAMTPDTNCWNTDFLLAYNDPMVRVYFRHQRYQDYPVVGVSFHQAMAYCQWLTGKLNEEENIDGYLIEVDLPNQFEWAFANGVGYDAKYISHPNMHPGYIDIHYDWDFKTHLLLQLKEENFNLLDRALIPNYSNLNQGNFMDDGYMYTTRHNFNKKLDSEVHQDNVDGLLFLNTNVSEWCKESYQDNWADLYAFRQQQLRSTKNEGNILLADIEAYLDKRNDRINGRLVRGGNWLHEFHAYKNGANVGTHSAKLFVNPDEQHSTLGFRYVIRLVPIEEEPN